MELFHIAHCRIDVYSALQTEKKHLFASGSSEMRQIISIQKPTPCEQNGFTHFATALMSFFITKKEQFISELRERPNFFEGTYNAFLVEMLTKAILCDVEKLLSYCWCTLPLFRKIVWFGF